MEQMTFEMPPQQERSDVPVGEATRQLVAALERRRDVVGMSYRELARRSGCDARTVQLALTGRRVPQLETLIRLSHPLGLVPLMSNAAAQG